MATSYDTVFYDAIRAGCRRSAEVIVPLVYNEIEPASVIDVGCGEGWFGKALEDAGCEVLGVEGDYAEPVIRVSVADLEEPGSFTGAFDLAVCLEVAEHLSPGRAHSFVADLCVAAPVVLFSAAVPGQPGNGHVNCQWPSYWVDLFEQQGFSVSDALRWRIWDEERVEPWYRQNLLVASSRPDEPSGFFPDPLPPVRDVVHPVIWGWLR